MMQQVALGRHQMALRLASYHEPLGDAHGHGFGLLSDLSYRSSLPRGRISAPFRFCDHPAGSLPMTTNQTTNNLYGYTENYTELPDMPWEDRPAGSKEVMWRYTQNLIIGRHALTSNSIFNEGCPLKKGKYNYAGVFRRVTTPTAACASTPLSVDGIKWDIARRISTVGADPEIAEWVYGYDPRVAKIGDNTTLRCNGYHGRRSALCGRDDFETFHQLENAFLPYNRNGVLFPRKIGGRFAMLPRPGATLVSTGSSGTSSIRVSGHGVLGPPPSCDVSSALRFGRQCMKIGAGPFPSRPEGWLLFYHGVLLLATASLRLRLGMGFGGAGRSRPAAVPI